MIHSQIAIIKGDGIGVDVIDATLSAIAAATEIVGGDKLVLREFKAGAGYFPILWFGIPTMIFIGAPQALQTGCPPGYTHINT